MSETFGGPTPLSVVMWQMAERFGWTWEYIEGLSMARLHEWQQIEDGHAHANKSIFRRGK